MEQEQAESTVPHRSEKFFCPAKNSLTMVNFKGAGDMAKMKHPAALAFVEDVVNGKVKVRRYGAVNWSQKKYIEARDTAKLPPVLFHRHWTVSGTKQLCKALGVKKSTDKPARDKIESLWSTDTYEACDGMFIPVTIPFKADPWEHDTVALPVEFLKNVLVPACVSSGC